MCLRRMPGILSGPGVLWLGSMSLASWNVAGVMLPTIMFFFPGVVPAEMAWSQGKVARGFTWLYGGRDFLSKFFIIDVTRVGLFVTSSALGSRLEERLVGVGSLLCLLLEEVVFIMDLRASLGFLMNIARRAKPYLLLGVRLACFMVILIAV